MLLVIIVLGVDNNLVGNEISRIKSHTELPDHRDVCSGLQGLHKCLGSGLCNRAKIVDQIGLGHANPRVDQRDRLALLVGDNLDKKLLLGFELRRIREAFVTNFVLQKEERHQ